MMMWHKDQWEIVLTFKLLPDSSQMYTLYTYGNTYTHFFSIYCDIIIAG